MRRITNYFVICFIIGGLLFAIGKDLLTRIMIDQCFRITVATTTGVSGGYKTGNSLSYTYKVAGEQYKGGYGVGNGRLTEQVSRNMTGRRYYVKFSCGYPSLSKLLYDKEVPGSVVTIPTDGWDRIP